LRSSIAPSTRLNNCARPSAPLTNRGKVTAMQRRCALAKFLIYQNSTPALDLLDFTNQNPRKIQIVHRHVENQSAAPEQNSKLIELNRPLMRLSE
jgi:hypothetical protein